MNSDGLFEKSFRYEYLNQHFDILGNALLCLLCEYLTRRLIAIIKTKSKLAVSVG